MHVKEISGALARLKFQQTNPPLPAGFLLLTCQGPYHRKLLMPFHSNTELADICHGVIDCTLPKADWTHAAHFAAAFWMLATEGERTFKRMPGLIRAYNDTTGVPNTETDGYHETITLASLKVARKALGDAPDDQPLFVTLNAFLASEFGRSDWPLSFWSKDRLFSKTARLTWTAPDLEPLPGG